MPHRGCREKLAYRSFEESIKTRNLYHENTGWYNARIPMGYR